MVDPVSNLERKMHKKGELVDGVHTGGLFHPPDWGQWMQTKQNKQSRQGVGSAKVLQHLLLCLIHVVAWTSCHDGYMLCNRRLQSQPKGRPIHIIDKVAVMMQGGREATRGATLLTLTEKVTLAQGACSQGVQGPSLPNFSSAVGKSG